MLLSSQNIKLNATRKVIKWLVREGFDPKFGARPLKRLIQKDIGNPISDKIIEGKFKEYSMINIDLVNEKLVFNVSNKNDSKDTKKKN